MLKMWSFVLVTILGMLCTFAGCTQREATDGSAFLYGVFPAVLTQPDTPNIQTNN